MTASQVTRLANRGGSPFTETLTVILSEPYWEGDQLKHALLLSSNYKQDACHACGAPISGAIFVFQKNVWQLQLWEKNFAEIGTYGYPPPVKLIQIGPRKYGFMFYIRFVGGADIADSLLLYAPLAGHITQLLDLPNVHDEAEDLAHPGSYYVLFKSQYGFVESKAGGAYYDFYFTFWAYGTPYPTLTYVFNGSVYVAP